MSRSEIIIGRLATCFRRNWLAQAVGLAIVWVLLLAHPIIAAGPLASQDLSLTCKSELRPFQGVEYCTAANGSIHVVAIDLHSPDLRLEYILPEGVDRGCPVGKKNDVALCSITECRDVNRSTKQLGGPGCDDPINRDYYPVMSIDNAVRAAQNRFQNVVAVINGDYGAKHPSDDPAKWRDHGPEGFTVVRGNRLDGVKMGDGDNNAEKRPWLAIGRQSPLRVEIGQFASGEDTGDKPVWVYTGIGGAPWLIKEGEIQTGMIANCTGAPGSCYMGAAQTAVGISRDRRWLFLVTDERRGQATLLELANYMFEWGVWNAIKFDGGGSTHLWYDGRVLTTDNTRQLSSYLAVIAPPGGGIQPDRFPFLYASPATIPFDIVLPGETIEIEMKMRNEGMTTWSAPDYALKQITSNVAETPATLTIDKEVVPGDTISWDIRASVTGLPGLRRARYRMHYQNQPFGDPIVVYVIVLPEQLKDMEQELRERLDEWRQQGEQKAEEFMDQLWKSIQEEMERQAQSFIDELLAQCLGPSAMAGLALALVYRRQRRF